MSRLTRTPLAGGRSTPSASARPARALAAAPHRRSQATPGTRQARTPSNWAIRVPAAALATTVIAACGGHDTPAAMSTTLGTHLDRVSRQQVLQDADAFYHRHPGIGSFQVQDVQYTPKTRDEVLSTCTSGGTAPVSQAVESARLVACAPLIFFIYSYGRKAYARDALSLASTLYSYAVTTIRGPLDAQQALDSLLQGWGIPVARHQAGSHSGALETSIVAAAKKVILARGSVHIVITQRPADGTAPTERIVADAGTNTESQTLRSGSAFASIRITRSAAYFSGNRSGLTTLIGVSSPVAKRIGRRWVRISAGTTAYNNLARENLISALPASTLPAPGDPGTLTTQTIAGQQTYILTWQAASASNNTISKRLVLTATAAPLPVSETSRTGGSTQTVRFNDWGEHFTVRDPSLVVAFTSVTR